MITEEMQIKYPDILNVISSIEASSDYKEHIEGYTTKFDYSGEKDKLNQWINYLVEKDPIIAVLEVKELEKTTSDEKAEYINKIINKVKENINTEKGIQDLLLIFLHLDILEEAENLYKYIDAKIAYENNLLNSTTFTYCTINLMKEIVENYNKIMVLDNRKGFFEDNFILPENQKEENNKKIEEQIKKIVEYGEELKEKFEISIHTNKFNVLNPLIFDRQIHILNKDIMKYAITENAKQELLVSKINSALDVIKQLFYVDKKQVEYIAKNTELNYTITEDKDIIQLDKINEQILKFLNENFMKKDIDVEKYKERIGVIYSKIFDSFKTVSLKKVNDWRCAVELYLDVCSEYRTEEEIRRAEDFIKLLPKIYEMSKEPNSTIEEKVNFLMEHKKFFKLKEIIIDDLDKEKEIISRAIFLGKIDNKDYNWIIKYCNKLEIENDLPILNNEIIEIDDELKEKFDIIKLRIKCYIVKMRNDYKLLVEPDIFTKLEFIKQIDDILDRLISKKQTDNIGELINLRIELIYILKSIADKEAEKYYIYKFQKILEEKDLKISNIINEKNEISNLISFNYNVLGILLENSNYDTCLNYISILQKRPDYKKMLFMIKRLSNIRPKKYKEKIIKITNTFLENNQVYCAIHFLKSIRVKNYFEFLSSDKDPMYYINELKADYLMASIVYQKELYMQGYQEKYDGFINCTKEWIKYIFSLSEIHSSEAKSVLETLIEMLCRDITLAQDDNFVIEKMQGIYEICRSYFTDMPPAVYSDAIMLLNNIFDNSGNNKEIVQKLKLISNVNLFKYLYNETRQNMKVLWVNNYYYRLEDKTNYLIEKIFSEKDLNFEDIIFIYMNSYIKMIYPIEGIIKKLLATGCSNVFDYLAKYEFYIKIKISSKRGYGRVRILNVTNNNKSRIDYRAFQLENGDGIYTAKIVNYREVENELALTDIIKYNPTIYDDMSVENQNPQNILLEKYIKTYNDIKPVDFDLLEKLQALNFDEESLDRIIAFQMELLPRFNNDLANKLYNDNINPFRYRNYKNLLKEDNNIFEKMGAYRGFVKDFSEKYSEEAKEAFYKLLRDENIETKAIIDIYMNTVTRYFIPLDVFMDMLANERYKDEQSIDLKSLFSDYSVVFNTIIYNSILDPAQLRIPYNEDFLTYRGNPIKAKLRNELSRLYCYFSEYNVKFKKIYIDDMHYTNLAVNSNNFIRVIKIIRTFCETENFDILNKLKKVPKMAELLNEENIGYSDGKKLLQEYRNLYFKAVGILINDLEKLKEFIKLLGKNNYWVAIKNTRFSIGWNISNSRDEVKEAKQIFLEQAKTADLETIFYCYKNTYLRNVIRVDELLRSIYVFNAKAEKYVDDNGFVDLSSKELEIKLKVIEKHSEYVTIKQGQVSGKLDAICDVDNIGEESFSIVEKYNTIRNLVYCNKIQRQYLDNTGQYNRSYYRICNELFSGKYILKDICDFIHNEYNFSRNIYYSEYLNPRYAVDARNNHIKEKEILTERVKKYVEDNMQYKTWSTSAIEELYEVYKNTIIKMAMTLQEFLSLFQFEDGLKFHVIAHINEILGNNRYKVFLLNYGYVREVVIKAENVKLNTRYCANITNYDKHSNKMTLSDLEEIEYNAKENAK